MLFNLGKHVLSLYSYLHIGQLIKLFGYSLPQHLLEQLEEMEPAERKAVLDELSVRPDLCGEEEVMLYDG